MTREGTEADPLPAAPARIDRALAGDLRRALRSRAVLGFLVLEIAAGALFVARRGAGVTWVVPLVWLGLALVAVVAWWAGRHPLAWTRLDPVPAAGARAIMALVGATGLALWSWEVSPAGGAVLFVIGLAGWLLAGRAWPAGSARQPRTALRAVLARDPRPFVPLLLLAAVPRLLLQGPAFLLGLPLALPSGVGQELSFLLGLFAPLEAITRRTDVAAVASALVFAAIHVPFNLPATENDWIAAAANAVFVQGSVGLIACLAFVRHRAPLVIGLAHALAIA